jgi:putative membrane protein
MNTVKYEGIIGDRKYLGIICTGFLFVALEEWHMMDGWHMMDWWGIPFLGFWWFGVWFVQFVIAALVYRDAEKREKNGLLWFVLVILPWIGIMFLIFYLIIQDEKSEDKEIMDYAQRILAERYAKGEMTRREYLQAKEDIEKKRSENEL